MNFPVVVKIGSVSRVFVTPLSLLQCRDVARGYIDVKQSEEAFVSTHYVRKWHIVQMLGEKSGDWYVVGEGNTAYEALEDACKKIIGDSGLECHELIDLVYEAYNHISNSGLTALARIELSANAIGDYIREAIDGKP